MQNFSDLVHPRSQNGSFALRVGRPPEASVVLEPQHQAYEGPESGAESTAERALALVRSSLDYVEAEQTSDMWGTRRVDADEMKQLLLDMQTALLSE